jgi:hypothetical protein
MSSSPTATTSTTRSSTSCSSRPEVAVIACGALGGHIREIAARRGWPVELHNLPSLLHNHPERISPAAERLARELQSRGLRVALGYADCGSYGALDESFRRSVLAELGLDARPELWPDYFGHYRRLVWLAQSRDAALDAEASAIAALFGLPLTVMDVGTGGLERELALLLDAPSPGAGSP